MELEFASCKVDRFGWEQMKPHVKKRLNEDWINVLGKYPLAEVQRAIAAWFATGASKAPHEGQVARLIEAGRRGALVAENESRHTGQRRTTPEEDAAYAASVARDRINPEKAKQAAEIISDVDLKMQK